MPRISEQVLKTTAEMIAPRLRRFVANHQTLTPEAVRRAIVEERRVNPSVSNLQSARSLELVAEIFMERFS